MKNINKVTKKIDEVRYLTAENAYRYRMIMRCFFQQYERMKYWLYKEDIFEEISKYEEFQDYTIEECRGELDSLVTWKNLIPVQDTSKVATVEEFKNKQFRYRMSEYSVEIERMTIRLENTLEKNGSLEASLLDRIREELKIFKEIVKEDNKKISDWWKILNSDFKRLNENYQDYIGNMYSLKAEEMMKTKEFLVFKDQFIQYLREFIKGLQENVYAIEAILKDIKIEEEQELISKVVEYEKSIPRLEKIEDEAIVEEINSKWFNIKLWFLGKNSKESEAIKLFDITNEIIRKITRYAFQISESSNSSANRKEEYRKMAKLFLDCENLDEAFAGVDEKNIRDMFKLLRDLGLDFIINSQILWGDYDTVPALSICELLRPNNANFVTVIRYNWNGKEKEIVLPGEVS